MNFLYISVIFVAVIVFWILTYRLTTKELKKDRDRLLRENLKLHNELFPPLEKEEEEEAR